jgi:DNA-binding winged helix-turn-helix (wHTH) protein
LGRWLDRRNERLWRGHEAIPLSSKTFAMLCCLVTPADQLVTKDALLEAVWPETVLSESFLTVAMSTLRRGLGDQARIPRFIETVYGRGYRFVWLTGDLCLKQAIPDVSQAEVCFQQARSLELRAAISLSRLWQRHGKRAAAYDLLAPIPVRPQSCK